MVPCSWKESFGIECPACGAQRSFWELLAGHLWQSVVLFPALIPLLLVLILTVLHLWKPSRVDPKWIVRFFILTAVLMVVSWIAKMV